MMLSPTSTGDPYTLRPDPSCARDRAFRDTNGLTRRATTINTAIRNLVLLSLGQSLRINGVTTLYVPPHSSQIDVLNIYDGMMYGINGPLLGCSVELTLNLGPGHPMARVAENFIANGNFDRVILLPMAIGGTQVADWANRYSDSVTVAMKRLAYLGITPATTGVTFAVEWGQGSSDTGFPGQPATTQAAYAASLTKVIANTFNAGFSGRFFVAIETYNTGAVNASIQAAQLSVVNNTTVFLSGNTDTLDATFRQDAGGHWNDAGAAAAATLIYNAMHASGAPF